MVQSSYTASVSYILYNLEKSIIHGTVSIYETFLLVRCVLPESGVHLVRRLLFSDCVEPSFHFGVPSISLSSKKKGYLDLVMSCDSHHLHTLCSPAAHRPLGSPALPNPIDRLCPALFAYRSNSRLPLEVRIGRKVKQSILVIERHSVDIHIEVKLSLVQALSLCGGVGL
jgi:hypothetical protein